MTTEENPTTGDSGASITDRLEAYLSAGESPEPKEPTETKAKADAPEVPEKADKPDTAQGDEPGDQQPQLSTADLARVLGIEESALDVGEDGNVIFKSKIDGKEGAAKFADLVKDYQLRGHAENKAREAAEATKAAQARMQEVEQHAQQRLAHVEQLTSVAAQELMREYQSVNWEALRQADAGQYAALKADFQERNAKLQGVFHQLEQGKQQQQYQFNQQLEAHRGKEAQRLVDLVPGWKDQATFAKDSADIRKLASERGVPDQMLDAMSQGPLVNAGLISIMRDALEFQRLQTAKPEIENRVRAAPKIVKPGQAQSTGPTQRLNDLKADIRKSGGKGNSVAAYLLAKGIA